MELKEFVEDILLQVRNDPRTSNIEIIPNAVNAIYDKIEEKEKLIETLQARLDFQCKRYQKIRNLMDEFGGNPTECLAIITEQLDGQKEILY